MRFQLYMWSKTSFDKRASSLYVFEIFLSCNVLSNVAGFHDVISVINFQNIYQIFSSLLTILIKISNSFSTFIS